MRLILCYFLHIFILSKLSSICANTTNNNDYKVTIIHANDLFSAFSGVKSDNSLCDLNDDLKECIGGAPRIVAKIRELRSKEFFIFVSAGNNLGGFWYKQFGPKVVSDFFSEFQFDVIAVGLSDFELKPELNPNPKESFDNLTQFLSVSSQTSRVISCFEADDRNVTSFYQSVRKSATVRQHSRHPIGFIGFGGLPDIKSHQNFEYLKINDPIACLREQSDNLRRSGVQTIFAVGSGSEALFQEIVTNLPNIDVVIGSYGSSKDPSLLRERQSENYPNFIINGTNGEKIVVTADILGKSIGKLSLTFDSKGNIKSSKGNLIKMDGSLEESDDKTSKLVDSYQRALYIGKTNVYLNGDNCSTQECNLGNLITDALISFYKDLISDPTNDKLKQRAGHHRDVIALINSQMIVNSIGDVNIPEFNITKISLNKIFRGNPKIQIVILRGKTIRQLLEDYFNVSDLFQVSSLKVNYDDSYPNNNKIIEISVKCSNCSDDSYYQLIDENLYEVLLPENMEINKYNEDFQSEQQLDKGFSVYHILENYIRENSPINTTIENRITIMNGKSDAFGTNPQNLMTLFSTLITVCHIRYYN